LSFSLCVLCVLCGALFFFRLPVLCGALFFFRLPRVLCGALFFCQSQTWTPTPQRSPFPLPSTTRIGLARERSAGGIGAAAGLNVRRWGRLSAAEEPAEEVDRVRDVDAL